MPKTCIPYIQNGNVAVDETAGQEASSASMAAARASASTVRL